MVVVEDVDRRVPGGQSTRRQSPGNALNPDPKATVVWGQQVTDEMHSVYMIWTDINDKNANDNEPIQISPNKAFTTGLMSTQR